MSAHNKKCKLGCTNGHHLINKQWVRCKCVEDLLYTSKLGIFKCDSPTFNEKLYSHVGVSVRIEGALNDIRPMVAGVLTRMMKEEKTFGVVDGYQLVEIFLEKDSDFPTLGTLLEKDLVILMLGFGEVKNQRLPELLFQLFQRRKLFQKPLWVVVGDTMYRMGERFGALVVKELEELRRLELRTARLQSGGSLNGFAQSAVNGGSR